MWATKPKNKIGGNASFRFIITGGMLTTITDILKDMLAGTGGCGICAGVRNKNKISFNIVWTPRGHSPQSRL